MINEPNSPEGKVGTAAPEPPHLTPDIQEILLESFEVRGYSIEFRPGFVLVTRGGKTDKIRNAIVIQFIRAFTTMSESID